MDKGEENVKRKSREKGESGFLVQYRGEEASK